MASEPSTTTTKETQQPSSNDGAPPNAQVETSEPKSKPTIGTSRPPITICKRVSLTTLWTIFGLVFFYLVMVALSTIATGITLDRLEPFGWPRAASRHTAAVTAVVFSLFLLMPPSSLWSLFFSVMTSCAHFCHFVILSSDLRVYVDEEVVVKMFRTEETHPIFKQLPLHTAHVVGTIGFFALLLIGHERIYGSSLRNRSNRLPLLSALCAAWVWAVFNLFLVDRLAAAIILKKNAEELQYPFYFLTPLWIGAAVALKRQCTLTTIGTGTNNIPETKKTN